MKKRREKTRTGIEWTGGLVALPCCAMG